MDTPNNIDGEGDCLENEETMTCGLRPKSVTAEEIYELALKLDDMIERYDNRVIFQLILKTEECTRSLFATNGHTRASDGKTSEATMWISALGYAKMVSRSLRGGNPKVVGTGVNHYLSEMRKKSRKG